MIRLENVTKYYGNNKVLSDITIRFRSQELVCILGASGSGKTTLLNIIGANDEPTNGTVYLGKNNLKDVNKEVYHNQVVEYIYQDYNLINNLNVQNNILLKSRLSNQKVNKEKFYKICTNLGITKYLKKKTSELSGGERQRVAIARSVCNDSKIILADEPTGALDSKTGIEVMKILKELSLKKLVIVVTHNEDLAKKYASRIIRIKDGFIISDSNKYSEEETISVNKTSVKLKLLDIFKIAFNNILSKKFRNILSIIAFSIGLFSLGVVLSISKGFQRELDDINKKELFNYPLIIEKESVLLNDNIFSDEIYELDRINVNDNYFIKKNNLNHDLIDKIESLKTSYVNSVTYEKIDSDIAYVKPNNVYFDLVKGRYSLKDDEVMLLIDRNYSISEYVNEYLNIKGESFDNIVNKKVVINNKTFTITGIVTSNNNYFAALSGILYEEDAFKGEIKRIYIYSKDYQSKTKIKEILADYYIIDEASASLDLTSKVFDGITAVLIIFSLISLIVTTIMICIITYINGLERIKEIGLLKSFGIKNKDIRRLFLIENDIIAFISCVIALIFIYFASVIINNYLIQYLEISNLIKIDLNLIITIFNFSLILTYLASFFPILMISRKKIVNILRS